MPLPGQHARETARRLRTELVKHNWPLLSLVLILGLAAVAAVIAVAAVLAGPVVASFMTGCFLVGAVWFFWEIIEAESGARTWDAGAGGEDLTASALKHLGKNTVVHGLKFEGFDVDHVVIGPQGVLAVETKWTSRDLDLSLGPRERRLLRDLESAIRGARQVGILLRHVAHLEIDVRPALVLWGAGVKDVEKGALNINGVEVLIGRQARQWSFPSGTEALDEWQQRAAAEALAFHEQMQV